MKGRNTLAVGGIFIAVLMIFLQLGFYDCVPKAGMLTYNGLRFDILLTSSSYVSQVQSYDFPERGSTRPCRCRKLNRHRPSIRAKHRG